jgi:murein tripeptide amidase MpaA
MTTPTQDTDDVRVISARLYADSQDALFALVAEHSLDFGCRPSAHRDEDERLYAPAFLSPRELQELTDEGVRVEVQADRLMDQTTAAATIGQGDRFEDGARPPQGAGSREEGSTREIGPIMNVDEIGSAIDGLVNEFGLPTITLPNGTAEGTPSTGGQVGPGIDPGLYHIYFTAGVHARERGGPDGLIYFISDLLHAQRAGTGLTYGSRSFSNTDVITALNTGIVFFPLVNPDGVRHDQATDSLWRKNRNPASSDGSPQSVGVDINRNYDFLWDFRTKFDQAVTASSSLASDNPRLETFHGTGPFSEPETRNVAWILDQFPRLRWYMDIHSAAGQILYNWGDDDNQSRDPGMSFLDPRWDGRRGVVNIDDYREWISEEDGEAARGVARRVASAMRAVGGRSFVPVQAVGLFPTSGASDDYAFSRFQAKPELNKTYGYTMEFGYPSNFYPTITEFHQNVLDVGAGLMEFCLAAAAVGLD